VLTLNRNKIKSEYLYKLHDNWLIATFRIMTKQFNNIFKTDISKSKGSMFLHYYGDSEICKKIDIKSFNQWEDFKVRLEDERLFTMKELISSTNKIKVVYNHDTSVYSNAPEILNLQNDELEIKVSGSSIASKLIFFLLFKLKNTFTSFSINFSPDAIISGLNIFKHEKVFPIEDDSNYTEILKLSFKRDLSSARVVIPCHKDFEKLRLEEESHKPYVREILYYLDSNIRYIPLGYPKMISPFLRSENTAGEVIVKKEVNEKLINWVFDNRYEKNTSIKEIAESYDKFCEQFNSLNWS